MANKLKLLIITALVLFVGLAFVQSSNATPTHTYGEWSNWSSCVVPCGQTHGTKTKTCEAKSEDRDRDSECTIGLTNTIDCSIDKEHVVACEPAGVCPTACGQPESTVPNGEGGTKVCNATAACESAGVCPTTCGQPASTVPNGDGGTINCEATAACATPTPVTTNTGGPGDGRSDNLGCGSHDCSNHPSTSGQVLGASTGPQVLGLSTTSGDSTTVLSLIQLAAAFGFISLGAGLFRKHA